MGLVRTGGVRRIVVALAAAACVVTTTSCSSDDASAGGAADSTATDPGTYLALGDSVPFGYRGGATAEFPEADNFVGYPELVGEELGLDVLNAACPGETTDSFLDASAQSNGCENTLNSAMGYRTAYPLHVRYDSEKQSQLDYAKKTLEDEDVDLVTLQIGANDGFVCQQTAANGCTTAEELQAVSQKVQTNLDTILSTLRNDARYNGQIVVVTYYAFNYADPTGMAIQALDNGIAQIATRYGAGRGRRLRGVQAGRRRRRGRLGRGRAGAAQRRAPDREGPAAAGRRGGGGRRSVVGARAPGPSDRTRPAGDRRTRGPAGRRAWAECRAQAARVTSAESRTGGVEATGTGGHVVAQVGGSPFDSSGIEVGADGIRRYTGLPQRRGTCSGARSSGTPTAPPSSSSAGASVTYAELWDRARRVAGGLRDAGVGTGDRVALRLGNGLDWALAFWGAHLAGAVVVPMNTRLSRDRGGVRPRRQRGCLRRPSGRTAARRRARGAGRPGARRRRRALLHERHDRPPQGRDDDPRELPDHGRDVHPLPGAAPQPDQATLISVPLFHVTGCCSQFMTEAVGGLSVLMPQFEPADFLAAIPEYRITLLTSVPTIYELALRHPSFATTDVSSVRTLSYGGAPIAPELVHRLLAAFPNARLGNGFGLTETSALATFLPHEYAATHADAVGFPTPVNDVRIDRRRPGRRGGAADPRAERRRRLLGRPGETAETFVDGWLHTGDVARIDDGHRLRIVDRAKDMINRGGENVYSVEVENALCGHPDVIEVAVVGVPDPVMGEKVGAVVLPRRAWTPRRWCRR